MVSIDATHVFASVDITSISNHILHFILDMKQEEQHFWVLPVLSTICSADTYSNKYWEEPERLRFISWLNCNTKCSYVLSLKWPTTSFKHPLKALSKKTYYLLKSSSPLVPCGFGFSHRYATEKKLEINSRTGKERLKLFWIFYCCFAW